MNESNKRGLALLILGVIVALGGVMELVIAWYIGIALGVIGTMLMFSDTDGDKK